MIDAATASVITGSRPYRLDPQLALLENTTRSTPLSAPCARLPAFFEPDATSSTMSPRARKDRDEHLGAGGALALASVFSRR